MSGGPLGVVRRLVFGTRKPAIRLAWVALVSLAFLPALLLSNVLLGWVREANWSCSRVAFGASGSQYGGCSTVAGELIVAVAVAWAVPLLALVALLYFLSLTRRGGNDEVRPGTTQESGARVDRVALFVRAVAVLVGLANVLVIGDPVDASGFTEGRSTASALGNGFAAVAAGLVASEIVLRKGRAALGGGFLARYGIAMLGLCLGGAVLGAASLVLPLLSGLPSGAQAGPEGGVLFAAYTLLAYGAIAALVGGVLGAVEGLILGLPLAAVLGILRRPPRGRANPLHIAVPMVLVTLAALASYTTAPPQRETAGLEGHPPLSCPSYLGEEIVSVDGPGDRTIPAFETEGDLWGYQQASAGPGSLSVRVLDGEGKEVMPPEASLDASEGISGGSAEFGSSGTFSLQIRSDDDLKYEVLVCD